MREARKPSCRQEKAAEEREFGCEKVTEEAQGDKIGNSNSW